MSGTAEKALNLAQRAYKRTTVALTPATSDTPGISELADEGEHLSPVSDKPAVPLYVQSMIDASLGATAEGAITIFDETGGTHTLGTAAGADYGALVIVDDTVTIPAAYGAEKTCIVWNNSASTVTLAVTSPGTINGGSTGGNIGIAPQGVVTIIGITNADDLTPIVKVTGDLVAATTAYAAHDANDNPITHLGRTSSVIATAALGSGAVTVDCADGDYHAITIDGSWNAGSPILVSNGPGSGYAQTVQLVATISGSQTIDLSGAPWLGSEPTLDTDDTDVVVLILTIEGTTLVDVVGANRA